MSHDLIADVFRRFHRSADDGVRELREALFQRYGAAFRLMPNGVEGVLMEGGSEPFPVVITSVTGEVGDLTLAGYPDFAEDEAQVWRLGDVYAAEDRLSLLAALLDESRWRRA